MRCPIIGISPIQFARDALAECQRIMDVAKLDAVRPVDRKPFTPTREDWADLYKMLCGHCALQTQCEIVERMIEMKDGGPWPEGGWATDPGAGVSCLSYVPKAAQPLPRQQMRKMLRMKEGDLPPVCDGCAARKGTEASVSLHTRRDFQNAVANKTVFVCHQDPAFKRLCGGWCRAVRGKEC